MEDSIRKCLHCGETVVGNRKKKFCDIKCRTRYFSLVRYNRVKDDPAYKEYRKQYYRKWVDKNRVRFNIQMREVSRKWQANMRARSKVGAD